MATVTPQAQATAIAERLIKTLTSNGNRADKKIEADTAAGGVVLRSQPSSWTTSSGAPLGEYWLRPRQLASVNVSSTGEDRPSKVLITCAPKDFPSVFETALDIERSGDVSVTVNTDDRFAQDGY